MVLAETIYTQYDFKNKTPKLVDSTTYDTYVKQLGEAKRINPN